MIKKHLIHFICTKQTFFTCFMLISLYSCSGVGTIGTKEHKFNRVPKRIVWLHIDGLSQDHFNFLKFRQSNSGTSSVFERLTCHAKAWSYNTQVLRPPSLNSFLSQITGQISHDVDCLSFEQNNVFNKLTRIGFNSLFIETQTSDQSSLKKLLNCKETKAGFLNSTPMLFMSKKSWGTAQKAPTNLKVQLYHADKFKNDLLKKRGNDQLNIFEKGTIYFDQSCQRGNCYSSFSDKIKNLYEVFSEQNREMIFMAKIGELAQAHSKKSIKSIEEFMIKLNDLMKFFAGYSLSDNYFTLLITSSNSLGLEFPSEGKKWSDFNKKDAILFKRPALASDLWSLGANGENFCGYLRESDMIYRLLWNPKAY